MGAVIGLATALGPIIGGLIIQAFGNSDGWRLVFGVNIPIGIVALIVAVIFVPETRGSLRLPRGAQQRQGWWCRLDRAPAPRRGPRRDSGSTDRRQDKGWPAWTYITLAGGIVLIVLFALWENLVHQTRQEPIGSAAPVQPSGVLRGNDPGTRLLRGLYEHLLHDLVVVAGRSRPYGARVGSRLDPLRDRWNHRSDTKQPPPGTTRTHRPDHRNSTCRPRAGGSLAHSGHRENQPISPAGTCWYRCSSPGWETGSSSRRTHSSSSRPSTPPRRGAASGVIQTMQRVGSASESP